MKCIHCNSEVAEGTRFCPNCGSPVDNIQQSQQDQYQQSHQNQYQQQGFSQGQQGQNQYHQGYTQQKLHTFPPKPQLGFEEAVKIASQRLSEFNGRSRRSEYWWWLLAVGIGVFILSLIPYVNAFAYLIQFALIASITIRRLNDVPAPEWLGKAFLGINGMSSIVCCLGILADKGRWDSLETLGVLLIIFGSLSFILGILILYFGVQDSNPYNDPKHGPSPKYSV